MPYKNPEDKLAWRQLPKNVAYNKAWRDLYGLQISHIYLWKGQRVKVFRGTNSPQQMQHVYDWKKSRPNSDKRRSIKREAALKILKDFGVDVLLPPTPPTLKAKTFFGNPCKRGHNGERYINGGRCVECTKLRDRATWRNANREHISEYSKKYRANNPNYDRDKTSERRRRRVTRLKAAVQILKEQGVMV